ncbi:MAG: TonB-dependent receptor [Candidatus Omnitrophota bacterium]
MKYHKNRSRHKRQLFNAVVRMWWRTRTGAGIRTYRKESSPAVWFNAIGVAAFIGMGTNMSWAEQAAKMPDVMVTAPYIKEEGTYNPENLSSPKYTEPLQDIPQTITVVPQEVIADQGATTLRDVLRNVPGISIQAGEGGTPAGDQLSIRGYSARTDMFIDGVRDIAGYSRDPFNFEQVEVTKGPASSYTGRGSTGGSINMVSKTPQLDTVYRATAGLGTDEYKRLTVDVNQAVEQSPVEGTAIRFNAMIHDAETPGRDVAEQSRWGIAPSVSFGLGTPTSLSLSYFHMEQDNIPDYGVPWVPANTGPLAAYSNKAAPVDDENFYGLINRDYEDIETNVVSAEFKHEVTDHVSLRNLLRYGQNERDSIVTAPRFVNANVSTDITRDDWKDRDQINKILANQTDVTFKFETVDVDHTLVTGLEIIEEKEKRLLKEATGPDSAVTDLFNPNPYDAYTENIQHSGAELNSRAKTIALYAFDTLELNEQWEVNGGFRWDHYKLDFDNNGQDLERLDKMFSWKAGIVYHPRENGSLYFGYGTSFNPSTEGLLLNASNSTSAAGNIDLKPEKNRTFELGTKWNLYDESLALSAAVFQTDKTNARTQDPDDPADSLILDGEQRVRGIELGLSGHLTEDWQVFAGYTYLDSEVLESKNPYEVGNDLSNTPAHSFNLWSTYQLTEKIEAGGGIQFVDERYNRNDNNNNRREAPDYIIGDAMLAYHVNENMTMRLNVYNVADADYIDNVGGGHFIPGQGRLVAITSEFEF